MKALIEEKVFVKESHYTVRTIPKRDNKKNAILNLHKEAT